MTTCLLDYFSALDDPRQSWKVCYPLEAVLLIVLCASMAGAEGFVQIERWGNSRLDFLRCFLPFAKGVPSHDPLNDVINALPAESFQACFTAWVDELRKAACDHDALMRLRADNGSANRAAIKHMSLNLIRNINHKASIKARRKTLAWDDQYLKKAINGKS